MSIDTESGVRAPGRLPFALPTVFDKFKMSAEEVGGLSFVLLVGSYAEGLDSPTSDVDLVFVGAKPTSLAQPGEFAKCIIDGKRVEAWNLDLTEFKQRVAVADEATYRGRPVRELEFTHKLINAVCLAGEEAYEEVVAARRSPFSARMSDHFSQSAEGVFKDVLGALQSQDFFTAAGQAREIVGFAVDAYLASQGDTYPKRKWRPRRLLRLRAQIPRLAAEYIAIEFGGPIAFEEADVRAWIERCLALVRGFQLKQYFGHDGAQSEAKGWGGMFYAYRLGDCFVARTATSVLQLSVPTALAVLSGKEGEIESELRAQLLRVGLVEAGK